MAHKRTHKRLVRHPASQEHSSEEDIVTPVSPSLGRATSPHSTRFMKKIGKWAGRDELDFGCAGESELDHSWSGDGPSDLSAPYYSSYKGGKRASVALSLPSLTHSRAHSSSSDFSTSTVESSLPPSPTPSCSSDGFPAPLSPYTSRVPLTPRTAERRRKSDEVAAIDALETYFTRVRLSRVEEDTSPSRRASETSTTTTRTYSPPNRSPDVSSKDDFEIELLSTEGHSTFTPLEVPSFTAPLFFEGNTNGSYRPFTPTNLESCKLLSASSLSDSGNSSNSGHTTVPVYSPLPDSEITGTLEELSEYFNRRSPMPGSTPIPPQQQDAFVPPVRTVSRHQHNLSGLAITTEPLPLTMSPESYATTSPQARSPNSSRRPKMTGSAVSPIAPSSSTFEGPVPERRVSYGWI